MEPKEILVLPSYHIRRAIGNRPNRRPLKTIATTLSESNKETNNAMRTTLDAFRSRHSVIDCFCAINHLTNHPIGTHYYLRLVRWFQRFRGTGWCVYVCVCESTLIRVVLLVECVSRDEMSGKNKSFVVTLEAGR